MEEAIQKWMQLEGCNGLKPRWAKEGITTVRFSNTIARELANLITQEIDIKVEPKTEGDTKKPEAMQKSIDESIMRTLQDNIERAIRLGGMMAKWNGEGIEFIPPDRFCVTDYDSSKNITGCIFFSYKTEKEKFYTKAEWHRYESVNRSDGSGGTKKDKVYKISNKVYVSNNEDDMGAEISLSSSPWDDIEKELSIENLEKPLFCYLKNPFSNTVDSESPLGVSIFSECEEELRWLDIAMSTMGVETEQSQPTMFVSESAIMYAKNHDIKLPPYIKGIDFGVSADGTVHQWQPTLQVANRKEGINFYLSIISYKCGFDPGYFVFNGQTISVATATQVEATERRTLNTVLSYRNLLDRPNQNGDGRCGLIHDIAYILDVVMTMNGDSAYSDFQNYKLYCDFADITANEEEEKNFDYQLAMQGYMAKWKFLVLHKGMTEEEAKQSIQEAMAEQMELQQLMGGGLFGGGME